MNHKLAAISDNMGTDLAWHEASLHWYLMVPVYQSTQGINILVSDRYNNTKHKNHHSNKKGARVCWYNKSRPASTNNKPRLGRCRISSDRNHQKNNRTQQPNEIQASTSKALEQSRQHNSTNRTLQRRHNRPQFRSRADNDQPKNQKYEPRVSLHWYRMVPVYQD
jgi:hypothetical protein